MTRSNIAPIASLRVDPEDGMLVSSSGVCGHLGYPDQAREESREAANLCSGACSSFHLAVALASCCDASISFLQEAQAVELAGRSTSALSTEQGYALCSWHGAMSPGPGIGEQGQAERRHPQIQEGLRLPDAMEARLSRSPHLACQAEAYGEQADKLRKGWRCWPKPEWWTRQGRTVLRGRAVSAQGNAYASVQGKSRTSPRQVQSKSKQVRSHQHPAPNTQSGGRSVFPESHRHRPQQQAKSWSCGQ